MDRARLPSLSILGPWPHLAGQLCALGLPLFGLAWSPALSAQVTALPLVPAVLTSSQDTTGTKDSAGEQPSEGKTPPAKEGKTEKATAPGETLPAPTEAHQARQLPVSIDTIFRLAEEQNTQVRLARERVHGACAEVDVASLSWVPKLYLGTAYYRHEGGIQDEPGELIHSSMGANFTGLELHGQFDVRDVAFQKVRAERNVWQQKGELSRITYQTLVDASDAYMDLLLARSGEALARDQEAKQADLLKFVEGFHETGLQTEEDMIRSDLDAYRQLAEHMHQQQRAASARLAYLLGVDPCLELVPVEDQLTAFALIDARQAVCDLVSRALAAGPGVRELEGMLNLIQNALARAQGPSKYMPVFEVRMAEGAFGAGPGDSMTWDNRWDLGLQVRWDLGGAITGKARQRVAESQLRQVSLNLQDVRAKLASGVHEARETILGSQAQLPLAQQRIEHSQSAYDRQTKLRKQVQPEERRSIIRDIVQDIRMLREARHDYLDTLNAYDRAQLHLLLLLGPTAPPPAPVAHCP